MNSKLKLSVALILMLCILWVTPVAHASTVWEEDFDSNDNWLLGSYNGVSAYYATDNTYVNISGGMLHMIDPETNVVIWDHIATAHIDSEVVYGTWSFDFKFENHYSNFVFAFSQTFDTLNLTGQSANELIWSGYGLGVVSSEGSLSYGPGLRLFKYLDTPGETANLVEHTFGSDISGWNHIDIVRDLNSDITIFFNGQKLLTYLTDSSPWTVSDYASFASWHGNIDIDNLRIIDYDADPETETVTSTVITTEVELSTVTENTPLLGWMLAFVMVPVFNRATKKTA